MLLRLSLSLRMFLNLQEYRLVELCKGSEEYNWVAAMFHQTMTRPRATIVKIKLLQNPILWQFYNV